MLLSLSFLEGFINLAEFFALVSQPRLQLEMTDKPLIGRDVGQSHVPIWEGNSLITINYNLFTVFSFASSLRDVCALIRWFEGVALVLHFDLI